MPTLHAYGIDHSRASLEVREDLAFSESELNELLPNFLTGAVREVMLLSTCNRTEVYLVTEGSPAGYPLEPIRQYRPQARVMDDLCLRYHWQGDAVTKHLFAVASSLRSEVPGDTQIAAQVAAAARIARMSGTLGPVLEHMVAGALRTAKRVRRETGLAAGSPGTGPAVLRSLRRLIPASRKRAKTAKVLLLGAGVMAEEIASHLSRSGLHVPGRGADVAVATPSVALAGVWARDCHKSSRFAARFGIRSFSLEEAASALASVDAVIGACRGRVPLLSHPALSPVLAGRAAPLVVLDLGVPRNLDPLLAACDGLHAVFLDQLHGQIREQSRLRRGALDSAERIVEAEASRFELWWRQWPLRPIRADVYSSLESVLGRWRATQPGAVKHLRVALHQTLEKAFGSFSVPLGPNPGN